MKQIYYALLIMLFYDGVMSLPQPLPEPDPEPEPMNVNQVVQKRKRLGSGDPLTKQPTGPSTKPPTGPPTEPPGEPSTGPPTNLPTNPPTDPPPTGTGYNETCTEITECMASDIYTTCKPRIKDGAECDDDFDDDEEQFCLCRCGFTYVNGRCTYLGSGIAYNQTCKYDVECRLSNKLTRCRVQADYYDYYDYDYDHEHPQYCLCEFPSTLINGSCVYQGNATQYNQTCKNNLECWADDKLTACREQDVDYDYYGTKDTDSDCETTTDSDDDDESSDDDDDSDDCKPKPKFCLCDFGATFKDGKCHFVSHGNPDLTWGSLFRSHSNPTDIRVGRRPNRRSKQRHNKKPKQRPNNKPKHRPNKKPKQRPTNKPGNQ